MMLPVSGSRSGAPGGAVIATTIATTARKPNIAIRLPFLSASGVIEATSSAWAAIAGSGCQGPSRGSTIRSVTSAATKAMMNEEASMNQ